MSKSNWTLKHPRTLDEAFGDGTPRLFAETNDGRWEPQDVAITVISAIGLAVLITLSFMGVL